MGRVTCEVCQKSLRSRYNLKQHMAVHTGEKCYVCDICKKGYQQKWNLITHISRVHVGHRPFHCKDCNKDFSYSSHFKEHVKNHFIQQLDVPNSVKSQINHPHPCSECPRRFKNQRLLNEHLLSHQGELPYRCHLCDRGFSTRRQSVKHFQKPCNRQESKNEKDAYRKERTPCEFCGKEIARYSLAKHLNIHTRSRIYPCKTCPRTFLEAGHLSTHMRTHSGLKPHICDLCGKGHSQRANLLAHWRRHHGLKDKPPNIPPNRNTVATCTMEDQNSTENSISSELDSYIEHHEIDQPTTKDNTTQTEDMGENQCTGSETIHEFLEMADKWIADRVQESKVSQLNEKSPTNITYSVAPAEDVVSEEEISFNVELTNEPNLDYYDDVEQGEYNAKKELLDKFAIETQSVTMIRNLLVKAKNKKRKDILRVVLRKLGDKLPVNSIVERLNNGAYLWKCWDCQKALKTKTLLLRHRYTHVPPHLWRHKCEICHRTFTQAGNLKHHLLVHRQEYSFFCEICGTGFRHKSHFTTHSLRHAQSLISDQRFQCEICGKWCSTRSHLKEHMRTHSKEKPYQCITCGQQFGAYSTYSRHLKRHSNTSC